MKQAFKLNCCLISFFGSLWRPRLCMAAINFILLRTNNCTNKRSARIISHPAGEPANTEMNRWLRLQFWKLPRYPLPICLSPYRVCRFADLFIFWVEPVWRANILIEYSITRWQYAGAGLSLVVQFSPSQIQCIPVASRVSLPRFQKSKPKSEWKSAEEAANGIREPI